MPEDQKIAAIEKRFGTLSGEARIKAENDFASRALEGQMLTTEAGLNKILSQSTDRLRSSNDPNRGNAHQNLKNWLTAGCSDL